MKMNKNAQSQIITTVLIILLVLAAIVIVWQVVQGTVKGGSEEIERQSSCMGLTVEVTQAKAGSPGSVVIRPNKDITGYRVYVNGAMKTTDTVEGAIVVTAYETKTFLTTLVTGNKVEAAGKINGQWCPGLSEASAVA